MFIKKFKNFEPYLEGKMIEKTGSIKVYEFKVDGDDYFVRFYERSPGIWRRGYWYKEKGYFQKNLDTIKRRLQTETDDRIISRLKSEMEYFSNNVDKYGESDLLGKSKSPMRIVNEVSEITIDFLNDNYDKCDVLEIHHMKKGNEDQSTRLKLTQRSISKKLDPEKWEYEARKSTSIIYKRGIDIDKYNLEIY